MKNNKKWFQTSQNNCKPECIPLTPWPGGKYRIDGIESNDEDHNTIEDDEHYHNYYYNNGESIDGAKSNNTADKENESYEYVTETDPDASSHEAVEKETPQESKNKTDHNSKEVYDYKDYNETDYYNVEKFYGNKSHGKTDESYEYIAEPDPDAISYEEEDFAEKDDLGDRTMIAKGIWQRPYHW